MIARLRGLVDQLSPDAAVIDVAGVGYLAFCSTRTLGRLPLVLDYVIENFKPDFSERARHFPSGLSDKRGSP